MSRWHCLHVIGDFLPFREKMVLSRVSTLWNKVFSLSKSQESLLPVHDICPEPITCLLRNGSERKGHSSYSNLWFNDSTSSDYLIAEEEENQGPYYYLLKKEANTLRFREVAYLGNFRNLVPFSTFEHYGQWLGFSIRNNHLTLVFKFKLRLWQISVAMRLLLANYHLEKCAKQAVDIYRGMVK